MMMQNIVIHQKLYGENKCFFEVTSNFFRIIRMKKIYQITIVLICLSISLVSAFFSDDTLNESGDNTTEYDVIADNDSQMGEKYTADIDSQLVQNGFLFIIHSLEKSVKLFL